MRITTSPTVGRSIVAFLAAVALTLALLMAIDPARRVATVPADGDGLALSADRPAGTGRDSARDTGTGRDTDSVTARVMGRLGTTGPGQPAAPSTAVDEPSTDATTSQPPAPETPSSAAGSDVDTPVTSSDTTVSTTAPATETTSSAPMTGSTDEPEVDEATTTEQQRRGAEALSRISYDWRSNLAGWTIDFLPERDGFYGLTMVDESRIEIYVRGDQSDGLLAHVIAHELGHAVDVTLNDGDDRRRWQEARGIEHEPWWPSAAATDFSTGAGDFAESFAAWQTGGDSFRSELGPIPDQSQTDLLAELADR